MSMQATAIIFCATASLMAFSAFAQTVYNNFGPGHGGWDYDYGMGWTVAGINVPQQYGCEQAMLFQSTAGGMVTDIWVAFFYVPMSGMPDTVTIKLAGTIQGQLPDSTRIMEQWTLAEFQSWSQWNPPIHLVGNGASHLEAGAWYWLWATGGETTWCGWCLNSNPGLTCPHTLRREGQGWLSISNETASAFRVDVGTPFQLQIAVVRHWGWLRLSWNSQSNALYYNIYGSSNPVGVFELITTTTDTTWSTRIDDDRGFYRVTAELE